MVGLKSSDGIFETVLRVKRCKHAQISTTGTKSIWREHLRHCNSDVLQAPLPHVRGIREQEVVNAGDRERCAFDRSVRAPRKAVAYENEMAARTVERVLSDAVGLIKHWLIERSKQFVTLFDMGSGYFIVRFVYR